MTYNLPPRSLFYFGFEVTKDNNLLDFTESTSPLVNRVAVLTPKYYSPTEFALEVSRALTIAGTQSYSVIFNRTLRSFDYSAGVSFTFKSNTGANASIGPWALMGIDTSSDPSGTSFSGFNDTGYAYRPQFPLLNYVPSENIQDAVEATISETGSGVIEVVRFGNKNLMECQISFINNHCWPSNSYIEQNLTGYEDALLFMREIVKKGHIEFMRDRTDVSNFETFVLESTPQNSKGLGFRLTEEFNFGEGIYTTGRLVFRKVV